MKFAYADPPYLGMAKAYDHPNTLIWDRADTHHELIDQMDAEYDGWALHLHVPSLWDILPRVPRRARIIAWVKPFASFKPNNGVAYTWEPIIVCGGRKRTREQNTVRDYIAENITLRRGFFGAKPEAVAHHVFAVLNANRGDEMHDLFPGSGAVTRAWETFCSQLELEGLT